MRYFVEWSRAFEAWQVEEIFGSIPSMAYGPYDSLTEAFRAAKRLADWKGELP